MLNGLTQIQQNGVEDEEELNALIREFMAVSGGVGAELLAVGKQEDRDLQVAIAIAGDEGLNREFAKPTPEADDTDFEKNPRKETNFMDSKSKEPEI